MAQGIVRIEGKEISLDQQIIDAGIPAIKAVLSADFPDVENADVEILTPGGGAPKVATVVKRGTGKGNRAHVVGARSLGGKIASLEEYLHETAKGAVKRFLARLQVTRTFDATATVELIGGKCMCESSEPHPPEHFLILVAGPFSSPEAALEGLSQIAMSKQDLTEHSKRLRGRDITGGV